MPDQTLKDLFVDELKDIYDAERRLTKALPTMAEAAESEELTSAFRDHLKETEGQIERLDSVFRSMTETPGRKTCKAMVGLLEEANELMEQDGSAALRDAALIAAAQKVEHYEMATYTTLRGWAEQLGENESRILLQQSLDEEMAASRKLFRLAESIDTEAAGSEEDGAGAERGNEELEPVAAGRATPSNGSHRKASKSRSR